MKAPGMENTKQARTRRGKAENIEFFPHHKRHKWTSSRAAPSAFNDVKRNPLISETSEHLVNTLPSTKATLINFLQTKQRQIWTNCRPCMSTMKETFYVLCCFALSYLSMYRRSDGAAILLRHHKTDWKSTSAKPTEKQAHGGWAFREVKTKWRRPKTPNEVKISFNQN